MTRHILQLFQCDRNTNCVIVIQRTVPYVSGICYHSIIAYPYHDRIFLFQYAHVFALGYTCTYTLVPLQVSYSLHRCGLALQHLTCIPKLFLALIVESCSPYECAAVFTLCSSLGAAVFPLPVTWTGYDGACRLREAEDSFYQHKGKRYVEIACCLSEGYKASKVGIYKFLKRYQDTETILCNQGVAKPQRW